ncbi:MAG: phenylalanine--tRNA ligase subunit beta [bacterium]|nr:phenylalanine--tRNA ligase subunit beta [bacterium]
MKFSYPLLKKFVPALKNKQQAIDTLTLHSFEAEDAGLRPAVAGSGPAEAGGNAIEVKLPPNRYADCSGHIGIARELAAALGVALKFPTPPRPVGSARAPRTFSVTVKDTDRCPRYTACAFDNVRVAPSPAWLAKTLVECGLRPISNVVDIMNYVMLETGQPLHAFDLDRLDGHALVIRPSRAGERITTISAGGGPASGGDGTDVALPTSTLVIADAKRPQAIAGVKGGKEAEVTAGTTRILVEAATFEPSAIYRTSRTVNISTDASQRFARGMPTSLPAHALARAAELLEDTTHATRGDSFDSHPQAPTPHIVRFDSEKYERLIGAPVAPRRVISILTALGFVPLKDNRWQVPPERMDIETFNDVAEEVVRFLGYGALPSAAPRVALAPPADDPAVAAKSHVRNVLVGLGFDEVYTHSFIGHEDAKAFAPGGAVVYLENPSSDLFEALRPSLAGNLVGAVKTNARFFDACRVFEVGKVFQWAGGRGVGITERLMVGCALAAKKRETFFELKGALLRLLEGFGIRDITFAVKPTNVGTALITHMAANATDGVHTVTVMAEGKPVGYIGASPRAPRDWRVSLAELDLEAIAALASGNVAFAPLSLFPSVIRDLSLRVPISVRIGEVMRAAQAAGADIMEDVDLVDEYIDPAWKGEQSITLRFVFQAPDRTLTSSEVDRLVEEIARVLAQDFRATVR